MARKKKETKRINEEISNKAEREKVNCDIKYQVPVQKPKPAAAESQFLCFLYIAFFTIFVLTWLIVFYVINSVIAPTEMPMDLDMDEYWGTYPINPAQDISIRPYKIEFSDVIINDLRERLLHQRPFHPPLENTGFRYGFNTNFLTMVLDFWKNKYDFKGREDFFNQYDHFVTNIQGLDIHYMHVQPAYPTNVKVLTLLLLHSWPGSIREFYDVIPKLTEPNSKYKFVFEVIVPSLPGFGFSQAPVRPGMNPIKMSIVISKLMERIGRSHYYVQGGDIGHSVGSALATVFPKRVLGFHTSTPKIYHPLLIVSAIMRFIMPSFLTDPWVQSRSFTISSFLLCVFERTGYLHMHATKPDTIGVALTDSPAGLAAYIIEKFSLLTNPDSRNAEDGNLRNKFSLTLLLDNVMVYWVTNTITTSMRVHAEHYSREYFYFDRVETEVPTWGLQTKHYLSLPNEYILKRKYKNYLQTSYMNDGGQFAAMEYPEILAIDIFAAVESFIAFHDKNTTTKKPTKEPKTVHDFTVTNIHGEEINLEKYKGFVLLIVNVASECGLTDKNYEQLVKLYDRYGERGLRILAFPCNQFGYQEPGSPEDIRHFTKMRGVKFDVFSKVEVNGDNAHPLWSFLKNIQVGTFGAWIKWNFSKFIVNKDGYPVERFGPEFDPIDLEPYIIKYLNFNSGPDHQEL